MLALNGVETSKRSVFSDRKCTQARRILKRVRIYLFERYIALIAVFICPIMLDGRVGEVPRGPRSCRA
jgi:hypothetical protein